jgi:restriction system protein
MAVSCRNCGRSLDEFVGADPNDRRPCPTCGSLSTANAIEVGAAEMKLTGGVANLSVTRKLVNDLADRPRTVSAVGSAHLVLGAATIEATGTVFPPSVEQELPDVLMAADVLSFGGTTPDGRLVVGVTVPWFEIIRQLQQDPGFLFTVDWRKLEELIAGAFEQDGWPEVVLTPRSADKGRDVIATRPGIGSVRIIGQVKAYRAGRVVTADEVKAVCFTRELDRASKAMVMTTATFAPGIAKDSGLQSYVPHQLELIDGEMLRKWLLSLRA